MADASPTPVPPIIWAWRHPHAEGAAGRCIGHTDLRVDRRRAKGLARRIQATARRHGLPHEVHTSPLRRCADVGRWLRRWGWKHVIDPALLEMDFGRWEGLLWDDIGRAEVDDWCAAFTTTAPGGGETLDAMLARANRWRDSQPSESPVLVVAHSGWMLARRWRHDHADTRPHPDTWPSPPGHEVLWLLTAPSITFEKFRDEMLAAGYEEVLERPWAPYAEAPTHTHPFEANALVVQGEMWLTEQGGTARRLETGDRFHLQANVPHEERYGPQGAIYWVARRAG